MPTWFAPSYARSHEILAKGAAPRYIQVARRASPESQQLRIQPYHLIEIGLREATMRNYLPNVHDGSFLPSLSSCRYSIRLLPVVLSYLGAYLLGFTCSRRGTQGLSSASSLYIVLLSNRHLVCRSGHAVPACIEVLRDASNILAVWSSVARCLVVQAGHGREWGAVSTRCLRCASRR